MDPRLFDDFRAPVPVVTVAVHVEGASSSAQDAVDEGVLTLLTSPQPSPLRARAPTAEHITDLTVEDTGVPDADILVSKASKKRKAGGSKGKGKNKSPEAATIGTKRIRTTAAALAARCTEDFGQPPLDLLREKLLDNYPLEKFAGLTIADIEDANMYLLARVGAGMTFARAKRQEEIEKTQKEMKALEKAFQDHRDEAAARDQELLKLREAAKSYDSTVQALREELSGTKLCKAAAEAAGVAFIEDSKGVVHADASAIVSAAESNFLNKPDFREAATEHVKEHIAELVREILLPAVTGEDSLKRGVQILCSFPEGQTFMVAVSKDTFTKGLAAVARDVNQTLDGRFQAYNPREWQMPAECIAA